MTDVTAFLLRIAACVLFFPLAVPCGVIASLTLMVAGASWLVLGWDEKRIDALLLNPVLGWANDLPFLLFRLARREKARVR